MKAIIEIELGNSAFGSNDAERLFEMRNVLERLMDNADRIMAADVGDFTTAQDGNGNTVATLTFADAKLPAYYKQGQKLNVDPADKYQEMRNENWADSNTSDPY